MWYDLFNIIKRGMEILSNSILEERYSGSPSGNGGFDGDIHSALQQRILVIDGAMGTMIQRHKLTEANYRGERFKDWHCDVKGNNDLLNITQPQIITGIHKEYLDAGVQLVWILQPSKKMALVFHQGSTKPITVPPTGELDGGDVIPGFKILLSELFR